MNIELKRINDGFKKYVKETFIGDDGYLWVDHYLMKLLSDDYDDKNVFLGNGSINYYISNDVCLHINLFKETFCFIVLDEIVYKRLLTLEDLKRALHYYFIIRDVKIDENYEHLKEILSKNILKYFNPYSKIVCN